MPQPTKVAIDLESSSVTWRQLYLYEVPPYGLLRLMRLKIAGALALVLSLGCGGDDAAGVDGGAVDAGGLANTTSPPKRSDIHGAIDPDTGVFAIFGGDDGPIVNQIPMANYLADTWLFEPGEGWTEVAATGPSARGRHSVAYDSTNNRMLIFGGRFRTSGTTGNYTLFNDLWAFDFSARTWEQLSDGAGGPAARYFSTAAYDAATDTFYVYGGDTNPGALNITLATDVWSFKGGTWSEVPVSGQAPSPSRLFMGYTHDVSRNALIAFGGQLGDFVTASNRDLYSLDLASGVWSLLDDGTAGPVGRFSSLMTYDADGDRYLMMGGHADLGVANDIWAYDPNASAWSQVYVGDTFTGGALGCLGNSQEIPKEYVIQDPDGPERRSGGFLGYADGSVWLFGGESDCSDHLDDTWNFNLASGSWTEVLEATTGESCLRENNDCQCLCI